MHEVLEVVVGVDAAAVGQPELAARVGQLVGVETVERLAVETRQAALLQHCRQQKPSTHVAASAW